MVGTNNLMLKFFGASEFRQWLPFMSVKLLMRLDLLREKWGRPIIISPAAGALGRFAGPDVTSFHNFDFHGVVLAADIMVSARPDRMSPMTEVKEVIEFMDIAKGVGINGCGFYPEWRPFPGFHVDVRETVQTWGGVNAKTPTGDRYQRITTVSEALDRFEDKVTQHES